MSGNYCTCFANILADTPVTMLSTLIDFIVAVVIIAMGIIVNYKVKKKLKIEKRNTPIGRNGNVIEPITRWFCVFQICYWPMKLLLLWINAHELVAIDDKPAWIGYVLLYWIRIGRSIIGYNSLFVALIRYIYIVHNRKANQYDFKKLGRCFQIASIGIPLFIEILGVFTNNISTEVYYRSNEEFKRCLVSNGFSDSTGGTDVPKTIFIEFTLIYVPYQIVLVISSIYNIVSTFVFLKIIEGIFYMKIFQQIAK